MPQNTYHRAAGTLWVIVGVLAGLTTGTYFGITDRRLVFFAAVGVGLIIIVRINRPHRPLPNKQELQPKASQDNLSVTTTLTAQPTTTTSTIVDDSRVLSTTEAREWLDELLVKQQQK